jgi:hypothetical protein
VKPYGYMQWEKVFPHSSHLWSLEISHTEDKHYGYNQCGESVHMPCYP